jgi:hypothetical protein
MRTLAKRREDATEKILSPVSLGCHGKEYYIERILDHLEVWQLEELVEDFYPEEEVDA